MNDAPRFLIDANLSCKIPTWRGADFVYQADLNPAMSDTAIWEYARLHNMVIVTKDADFTNRILFAQPPPKVIRIGLGNMKKAVLRLAISTVWSDVLELLPTCKYIHVSNSNIEAIRT
jgi:predicted nuclease of predicted toxin-antitoxin system